MKPPSPLVRLRSRLLVLRADDIDTDRIIPARFLTTVARDGLGRHAFADWRTRPDGARDPDCPLNDPRARAAAVVAAGANFGCGSSREHAAWALADLGVRAVISTKIADIFAANAVQSGIAPLVVEQAAHEELLGAPWAEVEVDLEAREIRLGGAAWACSLDPFARRCLMDGVDSFGWLLERRGAIEAFERAAALDPGMGGEAP